MFMPENPEAGKPTPIEIPSDQELNILIESLKLPKRTLRAIKNLLEYPNNQYLDEDKIWLKRQLERILDPKNKLLVKDLKVQLQMDVENRPNIIPR